MKKLLNELIEKGWKPRWFEDVYKFKLYKLWYTLSRPQKQKMISFATETRHYINWTDYIWYKWYSLRELVSKESWLWQFVCENGMVEKWWLFWELWYSSWEIDLESRVRRQDYEFRIIQSALCDEDKLEDFILENVKIDE